MAVLRKKYVTDEGLKRLWERIRQRYDRKLDYVTNKDDSIQVSSGHEIAVRVSPTHDNLLKVEAGKGLYVSKPVLHKLTFGADGEFVYDGTRDITVPVYDGTYDNE